MRAVRQLAEHYAKPPDRISQEELRQYLLQLHNVRRLSASSFTVALCGLKFCFEHTLGREWAILELARPPREKKLPVVLSTTEVRSKFNGTDELRSGALGVILTVAAR